MQRLAQGLCDVALKASAMQAGLCDVALEALAAGLCDVLCNVALVQCLVIVLNKIPRH